MTTIRNFAIRQYKLELEFLTKIQDKGDADTKRILLLEFMIAELDKPETVTE